jgi:hypothetical protein
MYTDIATIERKPIQEEKQVTAFREIVEDIRNNALTKAQKKLLPRYQNSDLATLLARQEFVNYLKYSMAVEVAAVIDRYEHRLEGVYLFEESANPDMATEEVPGKMDLTVHLLVKVSVASAALEAFVTSLDRSLTELMAELPSPELSGRTSTLDIKLITQQDVDQRHGHAALLSSIHARPLKIWPTA